MGYKEYREKKQAEFNALPIFFAFSDEQFEKAMNERGLTKDDTDKIYKFGNAGGFYLKSDAQVIRDFMDKPDEFWELAKDDAFLIEAFGYEMDNHEYAINYYQGDWDVLSVFFKCEWADDKSYVEYISESGCDEEMKTRMIKCYEQARKGHYKRAEDWF